MNIFITNKLSGRVRESISPQKRKLIKVARRQRTSSRELQCKYINNIYKSKKKVKFLQLYPNMNFARTREAHVRTLHIGDAPHLGSSRCCAIRKSIKRSSPARQCFGLWNEPEAKAAGPSGRSRGRAEHNTLIINQVLHM